MRSLRLIQGDRAGGRVRFRAPGFCRYIFLAPNSGVSDLIINLFTNEDFLSVPCVAKEGKIRESARGHSPAAGRSENDWEPRALRRVGSGAPRRRGARGAPRLGKGWRKLHLRGNARLRWHRSRPPFPQISSRVTHCSGERTRQPAEERAADSGACTAHTTLHPRPGPRPASLRHCARFRGPGGGAPPCP